MNSLYYTFIKSGCPKGHPDQIRIPEYQRKELVLAQLIRAIMIALIIPGR